MTTTDANGILRWESTDPVTPLESTLNAGMDSVSAAVTLVKRGLINYVANTTARSALAATFLPTASKPLYVHRQDAPAGYNLEYTINGTTWAAVRQNDAKMAVTTANQGSISTSLVDITGLSASITVAAGQTVRVSFVARTYSNGANDVIQCVVREGSTTIAEFPAAANSSSQASTTNTQTGFTLIQPSAGAHTYKLSIQRIVGSGTITVAGSASIRNHILVENLGTL